MNDRYSYSSDEERFYGEFPTREAAIEEAKYEYAGLGLKCFWTGRNRPPHINLYCLTAESVIEHIVNNGDDFCVDVAEDWPSATPAQMQELTAALQATFREWMTRHKLEPTFWVVDDMQEHRIEEE